MYSTAQYERWLEKFRNFRKFSSINSKSSTSGTTTVSRDTIFRTNEDDPTNHELQHSGRFYRIPVSIKKQLFSHGGLPKEFEALSQTLNELCLMIRKPSVELINYIKNTNFDAPVPRFVLYGKTGTGKSLSLAHVLHYGSKNRFVLVHVPWVPNWFRRFKEVTPSLTAPNKYDNPIESVDWLRHFTSQNGTLLQELELKTTSTYNWSKRETTPEGVPLQELLDFGLNRAKYATGCITALIEELKKAAVNKQCRILVVIDGFNSFFSSQTRAKREDKSLISPSEFLLTEAFLSITKNDWNNGAVVVSVDPAALSGDYRQSHLPRYQLGKQGFEHLDPFVPIEISNYNEKEFCAQIDYYIERHWLVQPKAHTERGRNQLSFSSGNHPYSLMQLVAPY
uniref:Small ribosomal subunit protein mS29 n=1 Tax=Scapholeberis mucronata TaxID=202097 RepID=A0A4Y7NLZ9_9CRUS|nr:EOG090X05V1 [Scapholeberis mucronata]SVE93606.1 EOG090X05V1 [Scapholeberis mucronata]